MAALILISTKSYAPYLLMRDCRWRWFCDVFRLKLEIICQFVSLVCQNWIIQINGLKLNFNAIFINIDFSWTKWNSIPVEICVCVCAICRFFVWLSSLIYIIRVYANIAILCFYPNLHFAFSLFPLFCSLFRSIGLHRPEHRSKINVWTKLKNQVNTNAIQVNKEEEDCCSLTHKHV